MKRYGFIRNKNDIKFLILYALSFVKAELSFEQIFDICSWCDDGFDYFEFNEAFLELVNTSHLSEVNKGRYTITAKGQSANTEFEKSLPASVRDIAKISSLRVLKVIDRNASINTKTIAVTENDFVTSLEMEQVFSVSINVASKDHGLMLESSFKKNAEKIFEDLLNILTKEY